MNETYTDLQVSPREVRPSETRCRQALEASSWHLEGSARALARPAPDHREALTRSLESIRKAYAALLEWHGRTPRPDAALAELARPAEALASMMRTCQGRALPVEALEATFDDPSRPAIEMREGVQMSYYTARNTLSVVLGSLPERLTGEGIRSINRAQAIHLGRIEPDAEEQEPAPDRTVQAAPRRASCLRPGAVT